MDSIHCKQNEYTMNGNEIFFYYFGTTIRNSVKKTYNCHSLWKICDTLLSAVELRRILTDQK